MYRTLLSSGFPDPSEVNVAISEDGIKWRRILTLEDSPVSQYSYPAVIQGRDGTIHFVYTWRRQRIKHVAVKLPE